MRGYQKKIICLKNMGSSFFEEAYFIIKSDLNNEDSYTSTKLAEEAGRIIEENTKLYHDNKINFFSLKNAFIFGTGFLSSALLSMIIFIILN